MKLGKMQELIDKAVRQERDDNAYIADVVANSAHLFKDAKAAAQAIAQRIREKNNG